MSGIENIVDCPPSSDLPLRIKAYDKYPNCCKHDIGSTVNCSNFAPTYRVGNKTYTYTMGDTTQLSTFFARKYCLYVKPREMNADAAEYEAHKNVPQSLSEALGRSRALSSLDRNELVQSCLGSTFFVEETSEEGLRLRRTGVIHRLGRHIPVLSSAYMTLPMWETVLTLYTSKDGQPLDRSYIDKVLYQFKNKPWPFNWTIILSMVGLAVFMIIFVNVTKTKRKRSKYKLPTMTNSCSVACKKLKEKNYPDERLDPKLFRMGCTTVANTGKCTDWAENPKIRPGLLPSKKPAIPRARSDTENQAQATQVSQRYDDVPPSVPDLTNEVSAVNIQDGVVPPFNQDSD